MADRENFQETEFAKGVGMISAFAGTKAWGPDGVASCIETACDFERGSLTLRAWEEKVEEDGQQI